MLSLTLVAALLAAPQEPPLRIRPEPPLGARDRPLRYLELTTGLQTPGLDGGYVELELGDVNADGNVDVVSVGDHGSPFVNTQQHGVMVWFGNGRGAFSVVQVGNFGYGGVALGDANGDGDVDVGYGIHHDYASVPLGDQILEVALGDGSGQAWQAWDGGLASNGETWGMSGTDFADVDNDGDLDIGANSFGCCAGVHVYLNHGNGTWTQSFGFLGGNSDMDFQFADIDNDGNADFVALNQLGTVHLGDGRGGFTRTDNGLPPFGQLTGFDLGDIDGDGRLELARRAGGGVDVWALEAETKTWRQVPVAGLPSAGAVQAVRFTHADLDAHPDLVAYGGGVGTVYLNVGPGAFAAAGGFRIAQTGNAVCLRANADVDHNGFDDIVLVQDEPTGLFSRRNRIHFFAEASERSSAAVRVVRPGSNKVLRAGSVQCIEWKSSAPPGTTVGLDLSTSGSAGPWLPVAASAPDNGRYQWTVPATPSTDCRLRVSVQRPLTTDAALSARFEIR